MDKITLQGKLEALLFLYGEPVKIRNLKDILGVKEKDLNDALDGLIESLDSSERGLHIVRSEDRVQLTTRPSLAPLLADIAKEELDSNLTPASMETLSIVAYLGPCKRSLVEHIRGVNSSFILRNLMIRGLVERSPDASRANAFVYQITMDFLRHMGVGHVQELPEYEKYREFTELFMNPNRNEEIEHGSSN